MRHHAVLALGVLHATVAEGELWLLLPPWLSGCRPRAPEGTGNRDWGEALIPVISSLGKSHYLAQGLAVVVQQSGVVLHRLFEIPCVFAPACFCRTY